MNNQHFYGFIFTFFYGVEFFLHHILFFYIHINGDLTFKNKKYLGLSFSLINDFTTKFKYTHIRTYIRAYNIDENIHSFIISINN
jgi:hypothetical protein